jgi:hypothetical protein
LYRVIAVSAEGILTTLRSWIESNDWLQGILLTSKIDTLLSGLEVDPATISGPVGGAYNGKAQLGGAAHPLFFDLSLAPLGPPLPFRFALRPDGFDLAFDLGQVPPATRFTDLAADSAGRSFTPAIHNGAAGGEEWLTATAGQVRVLGATIALVIEGRKGTQATMRLGPSIDQPDGVVRLTLDPPTVMLGSSGFGLELPDGFFIDMSTQAAPPPASVDGHPIVLPGDTPAWKGLSIRNARFYLPESVPLFGRTRRRCADRDRARSHRDSAVGGSPRAGTGRQACNDGAHRMRRSDRDRSRFFSADAGRGRGGTAGRPVP